MRRVGIVGGGQLGRMLAMAAQRLGMEVVVLDPQPGCPASALAARQIVAQFDDAQGLAQLVSGCDVTTFELEHIDAGVLADLASEGHAVRPSPDLLAVVQDKLLQKQLLLDAGIATADFVDLPLSHQPPLEALEAFGFPLVQKARRGGYDGRGVAVMRSADDVSGYLPVPSLVERFVPAVKELAVVVARSVEADVACYPAVEMGFRAGENVLDLLLAPADLEESVSAKARDLALRTVEALEGVGVFAVEMFLTAEGELLVNEVAPRVHNSGHHTIEACDTDQFEQHLRAVAGLPLGSTRQFSPAAMVNLLGADGSQGQPVVRGLAEVLALPGVAVHFYGKSASKPHRKMGHVTVLAETLDEAASRARRVRDVLVISGEQAL